MKSVAPHIFSLFSSSSVLHFFLPSIVLCVRIFLLFLNSGWHCGHSCPIVPASGDDSEDDCGEADGL
jgi:hypothetical protein